MSKRGRESSGHMVGGLFTFALFGVFILLSLLIVVIGVDGYRGVVETGDSVAELRTSLGYVVGKLRSNAASDGVRFERADGVEALVLSETYEAYFIDTYIYFYGGALYELSKFTGSEFDPEDGIRLAEVAGFEMAPEGDRLVRLTATTADGRVQTVHAALRGRLGVTVDD